MTEAIARLLRKHTKKKESSRVVLVIDEFQLQLFLLQQTTMARKEMHMDVVLALVVILAAVINIVINIVINMAIADGLRLHPSCR